MAKYAASNMSSRKPHLLRKPRLVLREDGLHRIVTNAREIPYNFHMDERHLVVFATPKKVGR